MAELTGQLLFAPPDKRQQQVRQAETLHDQIEPDQTYPLDFVTYRITGYRPRKAVDEQTLLVGAALKADLRLLIDSLSRSLDMAAIDGEQVETPRQLAARLGVSTKTIDRWRQTSLRWRWMLLPDSERRQVVIPRAAVDAMVADQGERVRRASRFTRMDVAQRTRLVERARRLTRGANLSRHQIARRLALQVGRSPETIRAILEKHDRQHPDNPIFPDEGGKLSDRQRRVIMRAMRRGVDAPRIMKRFRCSRSTVYRVVHEQRAQALQDRTIGYSTLPWFEQAAEAVDKGEGIAAVLHHHAPLPEPAWTAESAPRPAALDDLPAPLRDFYDQPRTDRETQRVLAIQMNFHRYLAARQRDRLPASNPRVADLDAINARLERGDAIGRELVRMNLHVVLATARRHVQGHEDRLLRLFDLLELGNRVLIEAIDQYDVARGRSLEWYVTWRLMQRFVRERLKAETTLTAALGDPLTLARRRELPQQVYERMVAQARQHGIDLRLPNPRTPAAAPTADQESDATPPAQ
jgi:RNA polymerase primary sigma factor